jgi:hypothetical protein
MYMEMSQGDTLYSYLKCHFSKMENRKVKQVPFGGWHQWEGEEIRKGCRR